MFTPRRFALLALAAAAFALAWALGSVLLPLFLAFLMAWALDPAVDRLQSRGVPRALAAPLVMAAVVGTVACVLFFAVPYFADEFSSAAQQLPSQLTDLKGRIDRLAWSILHVKLPHTWRDLGSRLSGELQSRAPQIVEGAAAALFGTLNALLVGVGALVVPVLALYLLLDFDRVKAGAGELVPRRFAPAVTSVGGEIADTLGRYLRGQTIACVVLATLYAAGLSAVGLRLAIPIGVLTGMLAFVPYVGFGLGLTLAVAMALLDWHGGAHVAQTVGVLLAVQTLDGLVVTPRVVGGSVGLKPLEVILVLMASGTLFGFVGVLLAVPIGAVTKIVVGRATRAYLASAYDREAARPSLPPEAAPSAAP